MTTSTPTTTARFVTTHNILTLDAHHPFTRKSLLDAQEMHRTVMSGFRGWITERRPDARKLMGILSTWTLDLSNARLILIIQANIPADWTHIPTPALAEEPRTILIDNTIRLGDTYTFRAVVNPTRDRNTSTGPHTPGTRRRSPHHTTHHAQTWFTNRLQPAGHPPTSPTGIKRIGADTTNPTVRMLPTTSSTTRAGLRITRAEIKGTLTVTEPTTFHDTLIHGVGHARAYSAGLLLIRPPTTTITNQTEPHHRRP